MIIRSSECDISADVHLQEIGQSHLFDHGWVRGGCQMFLFKGTSDLKLKDKSPLSDIAFFMHSHADLL